MTVIRPNSISGINSITGQGGDINLFRADGTKADIPIVNNITAGIVTASGYNVGTGLTVRANYIGLTGDVSATGVITATSFSGSGANLTGIDATSIKFGSDIKVQANNSGANLTGILTVTKNADSKTVITGSSVGIGTTTTTGRNAGVGTAVGTMIFNSSENRLQVYTHDNIWANFSPGTPITVSGGTVANNTNRSGYVTHTFNSPGTFNTDASLSGVEVMVIGGGGGGGRTRYGSGGGAGGVAFRGSQTIGSPQAVVIGPGGAGASGSPHMGTSGTNSTFGTGPTLMTGKGGGGGTSYDSPVQYTGAPGGSGGGATARGNSAGGSATQPGTTSPGTDYGNAGGGYNIGPGGYAACGGGGAGGAGASTPVQYVGGGNGGIGVQLSISGSATYYAGGGASSIYNNLGPVSGHSGPSDHFGAGGNGGGGTSNDNLNTGTYPGASPNQNGVANSGGGGAGGHGASGSPLNFSTDHGGSGGSGKVIIAYPVTQPNGEIKVG